MIVQRNRISRKTAKEKTNKAHTISNVFAFTKKGSQVDTYHRHEPQFADSFNDIKEQVLGAVLLKQKADAVLHARIVEPTCLLDLAQIIDEEHRPPDDNLRWRPEKQRNGPIVEAMDVRRNILTIQCRGAKCRIWSAVTHSMSMGNAKYIH